MGDYKFDIGDNPELSEAIQNKLFELGGEWSGNGTIVRRTDKPYLYLNDGHYLAFGNSKDCFDTDQNTLMTLDALYRLPKPDPKLHPITIDGTTINLSEQSFLELKKQLVD